MNVSIACINGSNNEDKQSLVLAGTSPYEDFTLEPDTCTYTKFTAKTINNEAGYLTMVICKKKELIAKLAWKIVKILCREEFALCDFCLDMFYSSPLLLVTTNAIELYYSQLLLKAKTKFYINQMKVEVACLCVLMQ